MLLEVENVTKRFGDTVALDDVSIQVESGEILCILGPSGCGKTTLLRVVAGLGVPDAGRILLDDQDIDDVPPHRRGFGLMFQEYALFPHKNVWENVAFGLRMAKLSRDETSSRVQEVLELVGLGGFENRDVNDLSGGERQRVALARSLAPAPRLLMLDEPLGALDRSLRERLMQELRHILQTVGQTALYVTHDQQEAFAVAERIVIMNEGRVVQKGTPEEVYHQPVDAFVAEFLGLTNLLQGEISGITDDGPVVETAIGTLRAPRADEIVVGPGQAVTILIRPEGLALVPTSDRAFSGTLRERTFQGSRWDVTLAIDDGPEMEFELPAPARGLPAEGDRVSFRFQPDAITLLRS